MIANQKSRGRWRWEERVEAMRDYARLANLRYDNGYSGYLEVLDAERGLFLRNSITRRPRVTLTWRWWISTRRWGVAG